ncbi:hypothetical protein CPT_Moonbeam179 [Bacillus phage Moonbeam]|uniref:Uncharacterized protein n=1 Tax=Bacillus phage Moonbeam TaxID=1540091 RepID=A0A0A0RNI9_9CAUD|nr:hypothetical protein CPT_Moonbeam179 [Bacillus phage Moonbeam]AIW03577.1 hypothetical protein CPT_Moonbeam179 [Bacillus phage Moonbeam]
MKFENHYLGMHYEAKKRDMIDRLWLWYQFNTEMFDKNLRSSHPSPNDPDSVIIRHPADKSLASRHADRLRQQMIDVAAIHDISVEELNDSKHYSSRLSMKEVINRYLSLMGTNGFDFIFTAFREQRRSIGESTTPILHDIKCACEECRYKKGEMFEAAHTRKPTEWVSEPSPELTIPTTRYVLMQRLSEDGQSVVYYYREM